MKKQSSFLALGALGLAAAAWGAGRLLRDTYQFRGKAVLITGGSRGLGLELARRLCAEGARVAILARDAAELRRAEHDLSSRGGEVISLVCDVSDQEQVRAAVRETVRRFGALDVLINNAGIIQVGPLENMTQADFEHCLRVNFWGPFYFVQEALPHLRRRPGARLVNIASFGGLVAVPHMAPYVTSKHALVGYSEALRAELARDGIGVTTVSPIVLRTGSHVNAQFKGRHAEEFDWFASGMGNPLSSVSSAWAARRIVEACRAGQPSLMLGLTTRLAVAANALFPNLTAHAIALVNRLILPSPASGAEGGELRDGHASRSEEKTPADGWKTWLADRMAERNNEKHNGHGLN